MKKFSHQVEINENLETNHYRKRWDKNPDCWDKLMEDIEAFKEVNFEDVTQVQSGLGYIGIKSIQNMKSAQSSQLMSIKKMKELFPDGNINDKWHLAIKLMVHFNKIKEADDLFTIDDLSTMNRRINSVKTLALRLSKYCDVSISILNDGFSGSGDRPSVCMVAVIKDENY
jgi:hypothetical protein